MPSASSTRYQSRLFNFLNRQSRRWLDRGERAVRHLKVATVWGVQILLYPAYMLVQTSLSVGRQLSASVRQGRSPLKAFTASQPQEAPPESDTPIQRVLGEVESLHLPETAEFVALPPETVLFPVDKGEIDKSDNFEGFLARSHGLTTQQAPKERAIVRGVASLLTTRTLVLVSDRNQILDILSPQQQQTLAAKISWEVANYLHHWRLVTSAQPVQPKLSGFARSGVLLPVKLFWRVMAWIQAGPVASATNLFGEATLAPPSELSLVRQQSQTLLQITASESKGDSQSPPQGTLALLDRAVAQLETQPLAYGSEVALTLQDSLRESYGAIVPHLPGTSRATLAIQERVQNLLHRVRQRLGTPNPSATSPGESRDEQFQIQALIKAAIDYFFGSRFSRLSPKQSTLAGNDASALPSGEGEFEAADPWLTWSDLFGEPQTVKTFPQTIPDSPAQLPEGFGSNIPVMPESEGLRATRRYLNSRQQGSQLTQPKTRQTQVTRTSKRRTPSPAPVSSHQGSISPTTTETATLSNPASPNSDTHLDPSPDWIETSATPTGYVKHPLEQLLEWLDRGMVWLEEQVAKVWQWFTRH
jgi:hypothetical protein